MKTDLAVFAATSGHSGVDRVLQNLVPAIARLGLVVDVLGVEGHGPRFEHLPAGVRRVPLGAAHVNSAIPALVRYLRRQAKMLDSAKASAVFQLTFTDLDIPSWNLPSGSILPLFATLGMVDTQLRPKPVLAIWDSLFSLRRMP